MHRLVEPVAQDRTLAGQLSGAFVVFGALVAIALRVAVLRYAIGWAWLRQESRHAQLEAAVRSPTANQRGLFDRVVNSYFGIRTLLDEPFF